ncbi:MAG TPA: ABC transporter substrate-binding protein [Acidimicrobiales bacterium]|jgi:ABC-type branched-subunit amino acid transport system substrate-binding protein|nr:ABC transporter substrate-binding protein [Acidimicrobiales bacterium]
MRYSKSKLGRCGLALVIGAGAIVAGTGGGSSAAAAAPTPGVTATTVTVGSISDISSPVPGLFEGSKIGTEAYFAYINSQGGVNGRKLVLDAHDSAFSSGTIANATQSIAKNDFAIVGGFSLLDNAEQPIIDANKLPIITEVLNPSLYVDPNLYSAAPMVTGGNITGPYKWLKSKNAAAVKAVGMIGDNTTASVLAVEKTDRALTESLGYKWLYSRDASYTETTFLPDIIKMKSVGVKLVFLPTQIGTYIATIAQEMKQQNLNALVLSGANAYESDFKPGSAGNGTLFTGTTALYRGEDAKTVPAVALFDKWAKKVDPQTQLDVYTVDAWMNAQLFVQALKAAGANPTRASLAAQLNKITSFNADGLESTQNPAQKIPGQCWLVAQYENGNWSRISPDPKTGFVCNPNGFFPSSYKGISR